MLKYRTISPQKTKGAAMYLIVFDTVFMRPGGATTQLILGGDPKIINLFPTQTWLPSPTPDMKLLQVDDRQLTQLIMMSITATKQTVH